GTAPSDGYIPLTAVPKRSLGTVEQHSLRRDSCQARFPTSRAPEEPVVAGIWPRREPPAGGGAAAVGRRSILVSGPAVSLWSPQLQRGVVPNECREPAAADRRSPARGGRRGRAAQAQRRADARRLEGDLFGRAPAHGRRARSARGRGAPRRG